MACTVGRNKGHCTAIDNLPLAKAGEPVWEKMCRQSDYGQAAARRGSETRDGLLALRGKSFLRL